MSLHLAEQYYSVARDLEQRASDLMHMAETLAGMADRICEREMQEKAKRDAALQHAEREA